MSTGSEGALWLVHAIASPKQRFLLGKGPGPGCSLSRALQSRPGRRLRPLARGPNVFEWGRMPRGVQHASLAAGRSFGAGRPVKHPVRPMSLWTTECRLGRPAVVVDDGLSGQGDGQGHAITRPRRWFLLSNGPGPEMRGQGAGWSEPSKNIVPVEIAQEFQELHCTAFEFDLSLCECHGGISRSHQDPFPDA